MRILFIHSIYHQPGGEDTVVKYEQQLMGRSDQVQILEFHNHIGWKGAIQFILSVWNISAARKLKKRIAEYRPDIIHLHNFHFGIGPMAIRTAKNAGIPVVMTLHNYRLLCPSGTLSFKGALFTESLHAGFPWNAIYKKVYRDSFFQTFWLAFTIWLHKKRGTWKMIDRYIVLTDFAKDIFTDSSLRIPQEKFVVKPNFIDHIPSGAAGSEAYFLFVGRLSEEKGIRVLVEAFSRGNYELRIAGDGPLKEFVRHACGEYPNIKFIGSLDGAGVKRAMQQATALVFPSIWYEGMPMTILEAFAEGVPVIASNLGAMGSMIRDGYNGLHFKAGDAAALNGKLQTWQGLGPIERETYRKNAKTTYRENYTPENNKEQLLNIYKTSIYAKSAN